MFDPRFYGREALAWGARRRFLHESLSDLAEQYAARDTDPVVAHGDPLGVLAAFVDAGWDVAATADATGRRRSRRRRWASACASTPPAGRSVGEAVDVAFPGALIVETDDGERERMTAGDCEHLRPV